MTRTNQTTVEPPRREPTQHELDGRKNLLEQFGRHVLVPCILVLSPDADPLLSLLQIAIPASPPSASPESPMQGTRSPQPSGDPWLAHSEAAEYLGVARTTLYHYACQERIESRKIGGRLQYRLSALDKFKEDQVRPARRSRPRGIIAPTLGSGK